MVREAVVNALIHRDYDIVGGKCQIVVTEDTVSVRSPGEPPPPITLAQLQSFTAPMLSRNPGLHFVFARMGMAEEQGLGIGSLRDRAKELGLPLPRYTWDAPYLVLTLYRTPESAIHQLTDDVVRRLTKDEKVTWRCRNCGYIHDGDSAPEVCPACAHPQAHFELVCENW